MLYILVGVIMSGCSNEKERDIQYTYSEEYMYIEYNEIKKCQKDVNRFDDIVKAIRTLVSEGKHPYIEKHEYTLTEVIKMDRKGLVLTEIYKESFGVESMNRYKFNVASETYSGLTSDDILVYIENGSVSVSIPVNKKYRNEYEPCTYGTHYR